MVSQGRTAMSQVSAARMNAAGRVFVSPRLEWGFTTDHKCVQLWDSS